MATKTAYRTTFDAENVIRPIFTGGAVALDNGARILATTLGEEAVLTDITTGKHFTTIEGDGETISTLTLTPSASHLIICSRSLSMKIYSLKVSTDHDTVDATLIRTLKPHGTPVVVLAVDKTSTLLATGAADGAIKVWDIVGGYVTHTFRGPSVLVSALHFFEVAAASASKDDSTGKKKDKHRHKHRHEKGQSGAVDPLTEVNPEAATVNFRLVSGSQDGRVRVWDLHKRAAVANLESHVSDVTGIDFSPDLNTLVTASRDKTIIWWDAKTWKTRKIVPSLELVEAAGFLVDSRLTYSVGANGCVRLWETETGRELTGEQGAKSEGEAMVDALYCREQSLLVCVQSDHTLVLYRTPSVDSVTIPEMTPLEPLRRISGTHDDIIDMAYLLPNRSLMALATNAEDVRIVSMTTGAAGSSSSSADGSSGDYFGQDVAVLKGHDDIVIALDTDWSGYWVVTGSKDNTVRLWRIDPANKSYTCYATFAGHAESVGAVALPKQVPPVTTDPFIDPLSHPPLWFITGSQDLTVKKWETPKAAQQGPSSSSSKKSAPRALFTRKAHDKDINAVDIDHSTLLFASASQDKTVKIWSSLDGEVQGILRGHRRGVWSVKFSPINTPPLQGEDGRAEATAGRGVVLTGSGDKTVKLWSLADYTCLRTFEGHSNSVLKVAWLPHPLPRTASSSDGDENATAATSKAAAAAGKRRPVQFASAGGDGLVKVWDANTGEAACTLDNHTDRVWALAVKATATEGGEGDAAAASSILASGSADSTVTFWRDTSASTQLATARAADEAVEQEQLLQNHVRAGSYREAIVLALQLNHPGRLLSIFTSVVTSAPDRRDEGSITGRADVDDVVASLSDAQLVVLLRRLRDWNANARTAPVAQRVLAVIVRRYPAERLAGLAVGKGARKSGGGGGVADILDALRAYTERHYRRVEELVDESYLVEYTLHEMDSLAPPPALEGAGGGEAARDVIMLESS